MANIKKSYVLSFDIGVVNMAYCLVEVSQPIKSIKVLQWRLINIDMGNIERASAVCIALLDSIFGNSIKNDKNTWVLVERQVPKNHNCVCLSYVVWTYFMTKHQNINVSFVGADSKPLSSVGKKRKSESIKNASEVLRQYGEDAWILWLKQQVKKDDFTDAYLQIVGNLERIVFVEGGGTTPIVID